MKAARFFSENKHYLIAAAVILALAVMLGIILYKYRKKMQPTNPVTGKITSKYGYRTHPITGAQTLHNGVDIGVPVGTRVRAPWPGTVKSVYSNAAGGKQIIITHSNGYTTGYAHLSQQVVSTGEKVEAGQLVALSGNTGNTTGPHLHFTLRKNGELVDPETVFDFKA